MKLNDDDLRNMHWRDRYEYEAKRELETLSDLTEEQLLERIKNRRLGNYFAIWRTIARKGTINNSAMILWDFLQGSPGEANMLHRYHCADALFKILGMDDPASQSELRRAVQWDHHGEEARQLALLQLKAVIQEQLSENQNGISE